MDTHPHMNGVTTHERVQNREEFRSLLADVGKLPETQRSALLLREIDAMSYEEIAQAMDTTVPGVKSLLVRARIALAESSQARQLTCDEVRLELAEAAEGLGQGRRPGPPPHQGLRRLPRVPRPASLRQQGARRALPGGAAAGAQGRAAGQAQRPVRRRRRCRGRCAAAGGGAAAEPRARCSGAGARRGRRGRRRRGRRSRRGPEPREPVRRAPGPPRQVRRSAERRQPAEPPRRWCGRRSRTAPRRRSAPRRPRASRRRRSSPAAPPRSRTSPITAGFQAHPQARSNRQGREDQDPAGRSRPGARRGTGPAAAQPPADDRRPPPPRRRRPATVPPQTDRARRPPAGPLPTRRSQRAQAQAPQAGREHRLEADGHRRRPAPVTTGVEPSSSPATRTATASPTRARPRPASPARAWTRGVPSADVTPAPTTTRTPPPRRRRPPGGAEAEA